MDVLVAKRFHIGKVCGSNPSAMVYKAVDGETQQKCVVKMESIKAKNIKLIYEYKMCKTFEGLEGFPQPIWYGLEGDYNVMVTGRLGESLETLFRRCDNRFSMKAVLHIGLNLVDLLERMHGKNYIHRDITPGNFLLGYKENQTKFYSIGLGLAKRFRHPKTGDHIPYKENQRMKGNPRYTSLNAHNGVDQSRRDDMESLCYLMIYFLNGSLPWQGVKAASKNEKLAQIKQMKNLTSEEALCADLPHQFYEFLKYCKGLSFEATPDYQYIRDLFTTVAVEHNIDFDGDYDWGQLCFSDDEGYVENPKDYYHNQSLDSTMLMMHDAATSSAGTSTVGDDFELI
mmetsp:Transcript_34828/g.39474  ORF Transcript_34828/g.39474 Transcript_34828/m.39474 type:complete len:342 (-) Transcript_34828:125-1150(-)